MGQSEEQNKPSHIPWHAAFIEAIQLELEPFKDILEFFPEYQLSAEPLRIDCVIIKKAKNTVIKKNIAAIFREANLVEYKSPDDYVSVGDFYKVYGYACLYASFEKVPITSLTLTFVESRYPRELLAHLKQVRGYVVEENQRGIYTVGGDILPIQVIDNRLLSAGENLWLNALDNGLKVGEIWRVKAAIAGKGKAAMLNAYLDAITRANKERFQEAFNMYDAKVSLTNTLEEMGFLELLKEKWATEGKAEGEAKKALSIAQNMINFGLPFETIISVTNLEPEKVKALYQEAFPKLG